MSSIPFRIVIHGLIALAPSVTANDPDHITALLLDTATHHEGECMSAHNPRLSFLPVDTRECRAAQCTVNVDDCVCTTTLLRKKIWLEITPQASLNSQPIPSNDDALANNRGLPANKGAAGDIRFVANLTKPPFNLNLDPDFLAAQPQSPKLAARMAVPFETLTACALSWREDQNDTYVQAMSFRKLGVRGLSTDRSQALAQMVMSRFAVEDTQEVTLHMSSFGGGDEISILLDRNDRGYFVELSNEPEKELPRDAPCDDGVARHFSHFYEFAVNPPPASERMIPHLRFLHSVRMADIEPDECKDPTFNFIDRPVCPLGIFIP